MTNVISHRAEARELFGNFFSTNIRDNGDLEAFSNKLMKPLRILLTLGGREVTQFTGNSTYKLVEENNWIWIPDQSMGPLGDGILYTIVAVAAVAGMILKAISWLFISETFNRNLAFARVRIQERTNVQEYNLNESTLAADLARRLNEEQEAERLRNQQASTTVAQGNISANTSADTRVGLQSLPEELLRRIAGFVGGPDEDHPNGNLTNLAHFRGISRYFAVISTLDFATQAIDQRRALISRHFFECIIDSINGNDPNQWAKTPRIKLLAHRVWEPSANGDHERVSPETAALHPHVGIQRYNGTQMENSLNFIEGSEMGDQAVCWGLDPLPFLAIRVNYITTVWWKSAGHWLGLCSDDKVKQEGVIAIHPMLQKEPNARNGRPTAWAISFPDVNRNIQLTPEVAEFVRQLIDDANVTVHTQGFPYTYRLTQPDATIQYGELHTYHLWQPEATPSWQERLQSYLPQWINRDPVEAPNAAV